MFQYVVLFSPRKLRKDEPMVDVQCCEIFAKTHRHLVPVEGYLYSHVW